MAYCFVVFICVYFIYIGSVYRYYESRRRLFLESSSPERNKQAEKNREATKLYNRQKRVYLHTVQDKRTTMIMHICV